MAETATLTLSNFLLARLAEDEAEACWVHHRDCETNTRPEIGGFPCDCPWPKRITAKCEADRRIVENAAGPGAGDYYRGMDQMLDEVLRFLAVPYADHPDYRDDWRP